MGEKTLAVSFVRGWLRDNLCWIGKRTRGADWGGIFERFPHSLWEKLVDLAIAGDLGGGGDRRSNLDLRPLHIRKPSGTLSFRDSRVVGLYQLLFGILDGLR